MKSVLIIGYPSQTQTAHQIQCLQQHNINPIVLDPYGQTGQFDDFGWFTNEIYWNQQVLSPNDLSSLLLNANPPEYPTDQIFRANPQHCLSWEDWYQNFGLQRDRSDTLLSLALSLENLGVPCFNPPSKSHVSRRKPYQLHLLRSVGCKLPNTLVTNNAKDATAFIHAQGDCIVKPAAGGSLTLSANELLEQGGLDAIAAPAIFQQRIRGRDIRVIMVNHEVVSSAIIDIPVDTLDFRGNADYENGLAHYIEAPLPEEVAKQCQRATQVLGLKFAGIDIRVTPTGEYVLLECNSSPIYLDVEYKLGHPITKHLVQALTSAR